MIIFDLDGTLADCEHRRHFVDRDKAAEMDICYEEIEFTFGGVQNGPWVLTNEPDRLWKPDWKSFYEACDQDTIIWPVKSMLVLNSHRDIEIWSGRCESVRKKTIEWINNNTSFCKTFIDLILKMRPIGDSTPDDVLKEQWLDEALAKGKTINFVFDDRPKVVKMWQRRGIFVFNCLQNGMDF